MATRFEYLATKYLSLVDNHLYFFCLCLLGWFHRLLRRLAGETRLSHHLLNVPLGHFPPSGESQFSTSSLPSRFVLHFKAPFQIVLPNVISGPIWYCCQRCGSGCFSIIQSGLLRLCFFFQFKYVLKLPRDYPSPISHLQPIF